MAQEGDGWARVPLMKEYDLRDKLVREAALARFAWLDTVIVDLLAQGVAWADISINYAFMSPHVGIGSETRVMVKGVPRRAFRVDYVGGAFGESNQ